jgi:hypothetical protein
VRRLLVLVVACTALAAGCGDPGETTIDGATVATTIASDVDLSCAGPAVVRPNCGVAPQDAGDRGGALQYTVWALLVAGLTVVFTVVFRAAKRTEVAKRAEVGERDWT